MSRLEVFLWGCFWPFAAIRDCWLRASAPERKAAIHFAGISILRATASGQELTRHDVQYI